MEKWILIASHILAICAILVLGVLYFSDGIGNYEEGKINVFKIRKTEPGQDNKYYIRIPDGGYNTAIEGSPVDGNLTALANCVGYAVGRYNELRGKGNCNMVRPSMACSFVKYAKQDGIKTGKTPKIGSIICWSGGADGYGHVAVVEQIINNKKIVCSESVYGGTAYRNRTYTKTATRWGANELGNAYKFEGFVYNPAVNNDCVLELRKMIAAGHVSAEWYDFNGTGKVDMKDVLTLRRSAY